MNSRLAAAVNAFLIALMFAVALWAIHELPAGAHVPTHWGPDGRPDAWTGKWAGLLFNPVLACILWLVMSAFPQGVSLPGKQTLPVHAQRAVFSCILLCQIAAETLIAVNALGRNIDPGTYISIALGILYIVVGVGFRQLQWNFIGFSAPLFKEAVWEKSHRVGRWIYVSSGLGIIGAAVGLQQGDKVLGVFILTLGAPLLTVLYSYLVARRLDKDE